MAQVDVKIQCKVCGKEFKHTGHVMTSKERISYAKWAEKNIIKCPSCYRTEKKQEKNNKLAVKMTARVVEINGERISRWCLVAQGDTYSRKDDLKKIGFKWDSASRSWYYVCPTEEDYPSVDAANAEGERIRKALEDEGIEIIE